MPYIATIEGLELSKVKEYLPSNAKQIAATLAGSGIGYMLAKKQKNLFSVVGGIAALFIAKKFFP